ncbi:Gfo/Idh/MocA family oxidoreductase [Pelagicoccus mobilis]|uniref:Gfo/Idh/MocA family oxidoreductase n=1 Tax=Pelagicoccus mobilis TaxID=415221 RepID=A0A934RTY6_9BACT|nr:Gfo/Idh/MocA family oxidoreductase [Pelagicoccus mobilis]MBK1875355.1 Gfo/Idh/MocA family oxidoreductase [Pelagicoccus mobilis]
MTQPLSRRNFLKNSAVAATSAFVLPRFSIGSSANAGHKLNVACIGIGGMGHYAVSAAARDENLVALCDVDWRGKGERWDEGNPIDIANEHPDAKRFSDFREMLDDMGDKIDVVMVSTPDHTHFAATMAAMEKGKHVFVQKPLAHNIWQVRTLQKAMHEYGVTTVMGNQGHTFEGMRLIVEWYQAGILGDVEEVHCWTDRPRLPWFKEQETLSPKGQPVPDKLDWDLWQGPVKNRGYSSEYVPVLWRGWWDYGVGSLGDIGCHCLDAPFWALELGMPSKVDVELDEKPNGIYTPMSAHVIYHFPARGDKPPVKLHWYEGDQVPKEIAGVRDLPANGMLMIGSEETILSDDMRPRSPTLWPRERMSKYKDVLKKRPLPRVKGGPAEELFTALHGGAEPGSNFDYAAPLTEVVLLGGLAIRTGKNIEWDAEKMRITNNRKLNKLVKEPARKGWRYGEGLWT